MPSENTTPNNAFPYPSAANNGSNFALGIADLAGGVDGMWLQGTLAARPAASKRGRVYYATDTGQWFFDTSSAWVQITLYATGTDAAKPAAASATGQTYFATDTNALYFSDGTVWRMIYGSRGATNIAASESRTNVAYGTLPTPDQVTGLVVPANGLIRVWYQALWQESVGRAARAAIFVGANQLKVQASATGPVTEAAATNVATPNQATPLTSCPIGLASGNPGNTVPGDVTTGQAVGYFVGSGTSAAGLVVEIGGTVIDPTGLGFGGGSCDIMKLPAGTYTVGVQYKASSGTVTSSGRLLVAQVISPT